jgi:Flp pilus assembly protein TadG
VIIRRLYAHARNEPGQAVVEMALVLPILMLILLGIFKFGILYNNYLQLTDATRTGARRLAVDRGQGTTQTPCDDATGELANAASSLGGTITVTITEDNDPSTYTNTATGGTSGTTSTTCPTLVSGSAAHVEATYPCDLTIFGLTIDPGCTLDAKATERVE